MRSARVLFASLALAVATPAHGAHPLATEDTGTQGEGAFELELGWQRVRDGDLRAMEFGPQLSYGVTDSFDAIVRPAYQDNRELGFTARGFGDSSLGFKWRPFEGDVLSAGTRVDVILPTGNETRGLGAGKASYHAVAVVTADLGDWRLHGNLGYNRLPAVEGQRRNLYTVSGAAQWIANETVRFSVELIGNSPSDANVTRWAVATRVGAIATVTKWLDVDVGYQVRLNDAGPEAVALAGATIRW